MANNSWKTIFEDSKFNTAVAASGTETISSSASNKAIYGSFNQLTILNNDAVDVKLRLDSTGQDIAGKVIVVPAATIAGITPEEGKYFSQFEVVNLDGSTAEIANKILYQWSKMEKVV